MNKKEFTRITEYEKEMYIAELGGKKQFFLRMIKAHPDYYAWKYLLVLRKTQYLFERRQNNIFSGTRYILQCRKKNKLGRKLGIEMGENCAEEGLMIFHTQGIVINGNARLGKNCKLHGNNCIGNSGLESGAPVIGNNVDIGVGAKIIGGITIADDIKIGAGAVVVKSCLEPGVTLVGVPAKVVKRSQNL